MHKLKYAMKHLSFSLQDNSEVHFKVKMTTTMGKLKKCYAERQVNCVFCFYCGSDWDRVRLQRAWSTLEFNLLKKVLQMYMRNTLLRDNLGVITL